MNGIVFRPVQRGFAIGEEDATLQQRRRACSGCKSGVCRPSCRVRCLVHYFKPILKRSHQVFVAEDGSIWIGKENPEIKKDHPVSSALGRRFGFETGRRAYTTKDTERA